MVFALRTILSFAAVLFGSALFEPIIVNWLSQKGWYEDPESTVVRVLNWLSAIVGTTQFPWVAGITLGLAAGLWVDAWARRFDGRHPNKRQREQFVRAALADKLLGLGVAIQKITAYPQIFQRDIPRMQSEIFLVMKKLNMDGYQIPEFGPSENLLDRLKIAGRFFLMIAPLIRENQIDEAKRFANALNYADNDDAYIE